jgi:hypothetical protein
MPFDGNPVPERHDAEMRHQPGSVLPLEPELLRDLYDALTAMAGVFGLAAAVGGALLAWA